MLFLCLRGVVRLCGVMVDLRGLVCFGICFGWCCFLFVVRLGCRSLVLGDLCGCCFALVWFFVLIFAICTEVFSSGVLFLLVIWVYCFVLWCIELRFVLCLGLTLV